MEEGGGGHGKRHGGRQRCAVGRVEARWWPGEVRKVVVVLGPRVIDRRGSDAGELVGGTGPPCNVNGEPAVTVFLSVWDLLINFQSTEQERAL